MIPHERQMVEKFAKRPIVLLGINSDESRSALKKIVNEQRITWPNIHDGKPPKAGAIANKWNIHGWPTIFLIDHRGVIRYRDLEEDKLEKSIEELIDKAESPAKGRGEKGR